MYLTVKIQFFKNPKEKQEFSTNTFPIQLFTKKNCPSHGTPVYSLYIIVFSGSKYSNVNTQYRQNDTSQ